MAQSLPNLVLYDGDCGVCNAAVKSLLKRDQRGQLYFAPLQGPTAREVLARHGREALVAEAKAGSGTMVLVADVGTAKESLSVRSEAVVRSLMALGGGWRLAALGLLVPRLVRDGAYNLMARNRRRFRKMNEACLIPTPQQRQRMLD